MSPTPEVAQLARQAVDVLKPYLPVLAGASQVAFSQSRFPNSRR